jgi:hypothetical protein
MSAAQRNPVISYLSPLQISNTLFSSNFVYLIGTLGSQNDNNVNITGGKITGITPLLPNAGGTGASSLTPNAVLTGGSTSTGAVSSVRPGTLSNVLTSTAGSTVSVGSFVIGVQYSILSLGTTTTQANWNTIAGTSGVTYAVGSVFTCTDIGTGLGDGTAQVTTWTSSAPPTGITATSGTAPYFGARAFASFSTISYSNLSATAAAASGTVTLTVSSHAYQVGHYIQVNATTNSGLYIVTAVTSTTIAYTGTLPTGTITIAQCSIYTGSQNVANVPYLGTGSFVVNYITAMPFVNYVAIGTAGTNNGGSFQNGDDNFVVFGQLGYTGIRTTQSIRGFVESTPSAGLENASLVSVMVMA